LKVTSLPSQRLRIRSPLGSLLRLNQRFYHDQPTARNLISVPLINASPETISPSQDGHFNVSFLPPSACYGTISCSTIPANPGSDTKGSGNWQLRVKPFVPELIHDFRNICVGLLG
jgi:hypothetical protein